MEANVALITGASAGIGKATARLLLQHGYTVYAAARRVEAMQDLQAAGARIVHLDLTSSDSIERCVRSVLEHSGRIDVLINNAGYGSYGAVEDIALDEARRQFEVNLFGAAALIQQVLPTMRSQRSGTIVNVSSIGGKVWSLLGAWYQATKFALEGFSDCLRNEVRPFGIHVVVVEPGAIKTAWGGTAVDNMLTVSAHGAYSELAKQAATVYQQAEQQRGTEPEVIAHTILTAIQARNPKPRYVAPASAQVIIFLRWLLSDRAFDRLMQRFFRVPQKL